MEQKHRPIRWWPLFALPCLAVLGIAVVWMLDAGHRQDKVFLTFTIIILATLLGFLWLLGFSRLSWRIKLITCATVALTVFIGTSLFQFKGFSGDLVPLFEWRWQQKRSVFQADSNSTTDPQTETTNYPQFLGPNRNGVVTSIKLNPDWETHPPKLMWRRPVGAGWSGFAVVGNTAITQEQENDWEKVVAYDLHTGEILWTHQDRARYYTAPAGLGPRATPTIAGNRVYTLGATGIFNCLDLETGEQLWTKNIFEENNAKPPPFGISISPLVLDDLVIVSAGGAVAYHKKTGEIAWIGHRIQSGYSSPMLTTLAGIEQVVIFNRGLITAHEPLTGKLLWKQPWVKSYTEYVAQPVPLPDDQLLFSTGYGVGAKLFQISRNDTDKFNVIPIWETIYLKAKFTNIIYHEGYIYGLDDGIFACINPSDGTRQWKRGRYGHGQTLLISNLLLVSTESGDIVLIEPDPENHKELARFNALEGKTWNTPALTGSYLLVRNDQEAACYQLPIRETDKK